MPQSDRRRVATIAVMASNLATRSAHAPGSGGRVFARIRRLWRLEQCIWTAWAVLWLLVYASLLTLALVAADAAFRYRDPGLRWLAATLWIGGCFLGAWFWWNRLRRRQPGSVVEWAERSEKHFPQLGSRLSTAMAFLHVSPDDCLAGSPILRRALLDQVAGEVSPYRLQEALPRRTLASTLLALLLLMALAGVSLRANRNVLRFALSRLVQPWSELPWPQRVELVVVEAPSVVAQGRSFAVRVRNRRGRLPQAVRFHMRFLAGAGSSGPTTEMTYLMNRDNDAAALVLDRIQRPFQYRVTGGDDDSMTWRSVQVVQLPRWETTTRRVVPPAYSRLPSHDSPAAIRALAGSRVVLTGRVSAPVDQVELLTDTSPEAAPLALENLGDDRKTWTLEATAWELTKSGSYRLRITLPQGVTFLTEPAPVEVVVDRPPTVTMATPTTTLLLAGSRLSVQGSFDDDVGLASVRWQVAGTERTWADENRKLVEQGTPSPLTQWPLKIEWTVPATVSPATELTVTAHAVDTKGQAVSSRPATFRVVTADEFDRLLRDLQDRIAIHLSDAAGWQRDAREKLAAAVAADDSPPSPQQATLLRRAVRAQTKVDSALAGDEDSAAVLARELVELFQLHPLQDRTLSALASEFLEETRTVASRLRSDIDSKWRELDNNRSQPKTPEPLLRSQQQLLEWLVDWSTRWGRRRDDARLRHQLAEMQRRQADLRQQTERLRIAAVTAPDVDVERRLEQATRRQRELQREWEQWRAQLESQRHSRNEPDQTKQHAVLEQLAIGPAMQRAAGQLKQRKLGRAAASQLDAERMLNQALELLDGPTDSSRQAGSPSMPSALAALQQDLARWLARQVELRDQTAQLPESSSDSVRRQTLADRQRALRHEVAAGTRVGEWHPAVRALFEEVTDEMSSAETALRGGTDLGRARDSQDQAVRLLEELRRSAEETKSARDDSTGSPPPESQRKTTLPPARILRALQQRLLQRTQKLDQKRKRSGLTLELAREIQDAARQQTQLAQWIAQAWKREPTPPDKQQERP